MRLRLHLNLNTFTFGNLIIPFKFIIEVFFKDFSTICGIIHFRPKRKDEADFSKTSDSSPIPIIY